MSCRASDFTKSYQKAQCPWKQFLVVYIISKLRSTPLRADRCRRFDMM
jgi:hypothetical protein